MKKTGLAGGIFTVVIILLLAVIKPNMLMEFFNNENEVQTQMVEGEKNSEHLEESKNGESTGNQKENDSLTVEEEENTNLQENDSLTVKEEEKTGSKEEQQQEVVYRFRNKSLLEQHFAKHGEDFTYKTKEEYEEGANQVILNPNALHKKEAEDNDDVYYLEKTNEFVIVSTDGYIRTYFKPSSGLKYYNRQ